MTDKINLTQLRETYIESAHYGNGTGCRCCDLVDRDYLLALIDTAEAARAVNGLFWKLNERTRGVAPRAGLGPEWGHMQSANATLDDALARFGFGDTPAQ